MDMSHTNYQTDYRWVTYKSQDGLEMGHRYVHASYRWIKEWVTDESQMKSQMNHGKVKMGYTLVTLSNTTFLIFF